jgi:IS30 family transposase
MLGAGANKAEIARALFGDKSTIKREIKRGSVEQREVVQSASKRIEIPLERTRLRYFAEVGQRTYEKHRQYCGAKHKVVACGDMVAFVEGKIHSRGKWSPDAAIGYAVTNEMFEKTFMTKTFYNWADDGLVRTKNLDLLLKVRRRANHPRTERKKKLGKSIEERPAYVEERKEFGHWEGDGIVGKRQKGYLITLVERKLRVGLLFNIKNKERERIIEVMDSLET